MNSSEIEESGYLEERDGKTAVDIPLSGVWSRLICEAGRWCENYASDLLVDIDYVRRLLADTSLWKESNRYAPTDDGRDGLLFRFGFRRDGVDHAEYIEANLNDPHRTYHYYRSIWELRFEVCAGSGRKVRVELKRVV